MTVQILNKEENKFTTLITAEKIYPLESIDTQVVIDNAYIKDKNFVFDLTVENLNMGQINSIRIVPLNYSEIETINSGDMPTALSDSDKTILFSNSADVLVFDDQVNIDDISIPFKELAGDNIFVLIVFEAFIQESSKVFLVATNKHLLADFSTAKSQGYGQSLQKKFENLTNLKILEQKTYTSDLLYSCDNGGNLSGLFCLDKEKIIKEFTKFPNLILNTDNLLFDQLVRSIEVCFFEYDKNKNGYLFSDKVQCTVPTVADNLALINKSNYRFYDFSIDLKNLYSEFQFVLKFEINDITINLAKSVLNELRLIRDEDSRIDAAIGLKKIYGKDLETNFDFKISNLNKIPTNDFKILMNKIINNLANQIQNASQKVVVNTNVKSQYTHPKISNSTFYKTFFEQKFQKKITLSNKKENNFFEGLKTSVGFPIISIDDFEIDDISILATSSKSFKMVDNEATIRGFVSTSNKDEKILTSGLQTRVKLSDANDKLQSFLAQKETEKFLNFVENTERKIKIYYLKFIGDSASGLVFSEIDDDFSNFVSPTNKVLVRIDNYEEFYSSYAYVVGN